LEAKITLKYSNAKTADSIANAVSPDNFKTPPGLFIKTERKGTHVLTEVKTEGKFSTLIATIDDLLFCISTAEQTLCTVKKALKQQFC
jgi:hypothetical protein